MIEAARDVAATVIPEHVLQVLVGLELEDRPELTPAGAAPGVIHVLGPRRPAQELVPLAWLIPQVGHGVGRVFVRCDPEVGPLGPVRIVLDRLPADDSPRGDDMIELRKDGRGTTRVRTDTAEELVRGKRPPATLSSQGAFAATDAVEHLEEAGPQLSANLPGERSEVELKEKGHRCPAA